jgi:hypothetical protein
MVLFFWRTFPSNQNVVKIYENFRFSPTILGQREGATAPLPMIIKSVFDKCDFQVFSQTTYTCFF